MHVVLPEQAMTVAASTVVKPAGDANDATPAGGIFAALLAALQEAAVDVAPSGAAVRSVETTDGDAAAAATKTSGELESDAAPIADEVAEEQLSVASTESDELLAIVGAIHANVVTVTRGVGAKVSGLAGASELIASDKPTPSPLQGTAVVEITPTNGKGHAAALPADVGMPGLVNAPDTAATASQRDASTLPFVIAGTPGETTPDAHTTDGASPQAPFASESDGTTPPATPAVAVHEANTDNDGQPQQALPIVAAASSAKPVSKPAQQGEGDNATNGSGAPLPAIVNDDVVAADAPRFGDDVNIEELKTSAKPASDALLQARAADSVAVFSDKSAAPATAASSGHANPDAQASTATTGMQARSEASVGAPAQPQAPEPPPRPTPTDLTQFAVKSVRYLAGRGEETMTVRLVPESLGELRLVVRSREHSLDVQLSAMNASVRDSLEQQLPALREALARDAGDARQVNITINTGTDHQSAGSQFARHFAGAPQFGQHTRHDQPEVLHDLPRVLTRQTTHAGQLDVRA